MSLFKKISKLFPKTSYNPQLDKARQQHDNLPKTKYDKFYLIAEQDLQQARNVAQQRYYSLAKMLRAVVKEYYSPAEQNKVSNIVIRVIDRLASKANIFPDMEYQNIWYTDHYDIIELARDMGFGSESLPHWQEESNWYYRYLELTASDLVQILISFAEEALLEEYQSGADVDKWLRYVFRETLKSRKRQARDRYKQMEALRVSPEILGLDDRDRN
ncbi:MAG: hypothetical protein ACFCU5_00530 [Pleurocapsa sp.]